jgi:hypothetical protein
MEDILMRIHRLEAAIRVLAGHSQDGDAEALVEICEETKDENNQN